MQTRTLTAVALAVVVLAAAGFGGIAAAQGDEPAWSADLYDRLTSMVERYNEHADEVDLGIAGDQLKNRYTNLYVTGPGGTAAYSFYLDESLHIQEMSEDTRSDAKLKMTTDKATIDAIADAENPAAAFRDAVENDDIVIAGEDGQFLEQVKWAILNFLKGILL